MDLNVVFPLIASIAISIGGALYARRQGLPKIQAEVTQANQDLIEALKDQLALANAELTKLKPALHAAEVRIAALEEEVERLEKRAVRLIIRIDELERKARS